MKILKFLAVMLVLSAMLLSCGGESDETVAAIPSDTVTELQSESIPVTDKNEGTTETEPESESESEKLPESTEASTEPQSTATEESSSEPVGSEPVGTYSPRAMMYHLVKDEAPGIYDALYVRLAEFESHLILLNELGYEYIFADEWRLTEKPSVVLTFDDGYVDNYTNMFPLLKKYGAKATVFLITDFIGRDGYMTRDMIAEMSASGLVSFQCHTLNHRDLRSLSADELRREFTNANKAIEEITGRPVKALAYPAGGYNETVLQITAEFFDFAYTTKSPYTEKDYTAHTVPRYYVARGYGRDQFYSFLR